MDRPQQFAFARQSAGHAPLRRPGSIRRTTSIDSDWPDGFGQPWDMVGRARDLLTPADGGEPRVLDSAEFRITASPIREILAIETTPAHPRVPELVGVRAGGASRQVLAGTLGELRGTPLFQLLDDYAGASLVAGWIWSQWRGDWASAPQRSAQQSTAGRKGRMDDICTGFTVGGSGFKPDGTPDNVNQSFTAVGPLENSDDPLGWHSMPFQEGPQKRRARRIDVWREDGLIKVDAGFQDSGSNPQGGRTAVHEYRVFAEIDCGTGQLLALQALPLILPYRECPGASVKATRMIGRNVAEFRDAVLETLPGTLGCTHLNDALRALADVPALIRLLP
ncbi:DUF2889 domain-containing protein [Novosphingobium sp.]|uniref:DUF2889 domain-containing protein n=1 Tax=Novosphingobium sp. TaxID=1874826 RepID=UPI002733736B|nr:DUF2889 domain-containing protein [Novosphingobium sp.]MDP3905969.1 DUF2889 domain-containing protein [Novosphingobium sp.]